MNQIKIITISTLFFLGLTGCKKDEHKPLSENTTPPGVVSEVAVENQHGQAVLTYKLPDDQDLSYVIAKYDLNSGQKREVKASYYTNSMLVDGFGDTLEHEIKLYAVNKSEVSSESITVTVKPLENPIWGVFRSLDVVADFGGIKIKATNETRANIAIIPMTLDHKGDWTDLEGVYTEAKDIDKSIRGLDTVPQQFAVTVRDRFLNYTDTLFVTLTPLYETSLSKSLYKSVILPGDANANYWSSTNLAKMWDGDDINWPSCAFTDPTVTTPQWLTFDLGQAAQLSRIVIWDYPEYLNSGRTYYYGGDMRKIEVWGSENPAADGSWGSWTLLGTYEQVKPSGSAYGVQSDEDYQTARAGFSWSFRVDVPKFRFLRIKCNQNWVGTTFMTISEVQVYGDPR